MALKEKFHNSENIEKQEVCGRNSSHSIMAGTKKATKKPLLF
jgi:hypothetical protein